MDESIKYGLSEVFTSIQGEGYHAGTMTTFIRFAGCSVGRPAAPEEMTKSASGYAEVCRTILGHHFLCDTDFRVKLRLTIPEILNELQWPISHVCLTGGEPMNQPLVPLIRELSERRFHISIETSGTVSPTVSLWDSIRRHQVWITCSPKQGAKSIYGELANEIKLLIDEEFRIEEIPGWILAHPRVYLQPINGEHDVNMDNAQRCLKLLYKHPHWRLSLQIHKILGER